MDDKENNQQDTPKNQGDFPTVSFGPSDPENNGTPDVLPQIKGYKILKKLGKGGMGIVYLAEKVGDIKLKVALKVLIQGMDSEQVLSHFEVEPSGRHFMPRL